MEKTQNKYIRLSEFLKLPVSKDTLWAYMGRDGNVGRYRTWYVAVCTKTHDGCSGYYVYEVPNG